MCSIAPAARWSRRLRSATAPTTSRRPRKATILVGIARGRAVDVIDAKTLNADQEHPGEGRLHNIYVTPDGKHLITGSIPAKLMTVIDLEREVPVWELPFDLGVRPMAIEAGPTAPPNASSCSSPTPADAVVDFAARKEVARIKLPETTTEFETDAGRATSPSHGIGVAPDNKTLWVTSIPNNAVFVYSLADLKLIGEVALPGPQGTRSRADRLGAELGDVHSRQQDDLHLQRRDQVGHRHRYREHDSEGGHPGG